MFMPTVFGNDLFDDFFNFFPYVDDKEFKNAEKKLYGKNADHIMKTDVKELDDSYELEMDLPGYKKEEIQISLEEGYMTINAVKGLDQDEKEKKTGKYIRRERYVGSCCRSFYVGENITEEDIQAEFKHGILKLTIPKKDPKKEIKEKKYVAIAG
ncbi:MAG: Hsp20/alpha crystallin family protein [Lachnospiraceae bacterium]|nr:Hsp20/alpha crystallin family protein [Lachnospiraceae bacterium]